MEKYHLLDLIGEGSFGKVYNARIKNSGLVVAIKFITKRGKNEKELRGLRQEIEIHTKLNHDNIVTLLDSFETSTEFIVVMEYASGELFEILEDDKTLPELEVQKIAKQLVFALHYLHQNKICHRDVKPQNILISRNGTVLLCDFGFAHAMSYNTIVLTSIKGTPLYMAPEMVQEQPYNHASDLWSLGCILYELYYGQPPFYTNNIYTLIQQIVRDPVKFPEPISPQFKSFLKGLLTKSASVRLNWPHLLSHPFIAEAPEDTKWRRNLASENQIMRNRLEKLNCFKPLHTPGSACAAASTNANCVGSLPRNLLEPRETTGVSSSSTATTTGALEEKERKNGGNEGISPLGKENLNGAHRLKAGGVESRGLWNEESPRIGDYGGNQGVLNGEESYHPFMNDFLQKEMHKDTAILTAETAKRLLDTEISGTAVLDLLNNMFTILKKATATPLQSTPILDGLTHSGIIPALIVLLRNTVPSTLPALEEQQHFKDSILTEKICLACCQVLCVLACPFEGSLLPFPSPRPIKDSVNILRQRSIESRNKHHGAIDFGIRECIATELLRKPQDALVFLTKSAARACALGKGEDLRTQDPQKCINNSQQSSNAKDIMNEACLKILRCCFKFNPQFGVMYVQTQTFPMLWDALLSTPHPSATHFFLATLLLPNVKLSAPQVLDLEKVSPFLLKALAEVCHYNHPLSADSGTSNKRAGGDVTTIAATTRPGKNASAEVSITNKPITNSQTAKILLYRASMACLFAAQVYRDLKDLTIPFQLDQSVVDGCCTILRSIKTFPSRPILPSLMGTGYGFPDVGLSDGPVYMLTQIFADPDSFVYSLPSSRVGAMNTAKEYAVGRAGSTVPKSDEVSSTSPSSGTINALLGRLNNRLPFKGLPDLPQQTGSGDARAATTTMPTTAFQEVVTLLKNHDSTIELSSEGTLSVFLILYYAVKRQEQYENSISLLLEPIEIASLLPSDGSAAVTATTTPLIALIIRHLQSEYLQQISLWPGASVTAHLQMVTQLIALPLTSSTVSLPSEERISYNLQQLLYREYVVEHLVKSFQYMHNDIKEWTYPFSIITKLCSGSQHFIKMFVDSGGLQSDCISQVLNLKEGAPNSLLTDGLNILSHLTRPSKEYYQQIYDANILDKLLVILRHKDTQLKSKACTLVGNLCKHNPFFYESLLRSSVIDEIIKICNFRDTDVNTRKFAIFALGNAAFHNSSLYEVLSQAIPAIVQMLRTGDDKAKLNAAGAISNLLRNGGSLCKTLISANCMEEILLLLKSNIPETPPSPLQKYNSTTPTATTTGDAYMGKGGVAVSTLTTSTATVVALRKIALITFSSFAAYPEGRKQMRSKNVGETITVLKPVLLQGTESESSNNIARYIARIKERLNDETDDEEKVV